MKEGIRLLAMLLRPNSFERVIALLLAASVLLLAAFMFLSALAFVLSQF